MAPNPDRPLQRLAYFSPMIRKRWQRILTLALVSISIAACEQNLRKASQVSALKQPGRYDVYLPGAGVTLGGILFRPVVNPGSLPGLVILHGWAPKGELGVARLEEQAEKIAQRGYVTLALSSRGWPNSGGVDDCGLKQPDDVVSAVQWLGSLPGVDRNRIGVMGFSMGGQIALLAAARSRRMKAIVAFYPPTDIERWARTTSDDRIRDYYIPQVCAPTKNRSPVVFAKQIDAPVLLVHGDRDTVVPTDQSKIMRNAFVKADRSVELHLVVGARHGFSYAVAAPAVEKFLGCQLKKHCT